MAQLLQESSGIADSSAFSLSTWFRVNSTDQKIGNVILGGLVEFGPTYSEAGWITTPPPVDGLTIPNPSCVYYSYNTAFPTFAQIMLIIMGPPNSISGAWTPVITTGPNVGTHFFEVDAWTHLALAVQINTNSASYSNYDGQFYDVTPTSWSTVKIVINGVDRSPVLVSGQPYANLTSRPTGAVWASVYSYNPTYNNRLSWDPSTYNAASISSFNIPINGYSVALPAKSNVGDYYGAPQLSTNPQSRHADFQMWIGTFIDPTVPANFAKLINITGGRGYPVNPSVAAAAFGMQTFLFKGKASDNSFFVNRGNGGAFTKIGTASDFTPTPSY